MLYITEINLIVSTDEVAQRDGVLAFATIVLGGCFVVRDIKVMSRSGRIFLGMPSKKLKDKCPRCSVKNQITDKFCHECGLQRKRSEKPTRIHNDIAFPINKDYRLYIEKEIAECYNNQVSLERKLNYG